MDELVFPGEAGDRVTTVAAVTVGFDVWLQAAGKRAVVRAMVVRRSLLGVISSSPVEGVRPGVLFLGFLREA